MNFSFSELNLLGKSKYWSSLSLLLIVCGCLVILFNGLNLGIDFRGGTQFTVQLKESVSTTRVRSLLSDIDPSLSQSKIQDVKGMDSNSNSLEKSITTKLTLPDDQDKILKIEKELEKELPVLEDGISRKSVGKQISEELQTKGWQAIVLALVVILIYISWRFRLRYAIGAVSAVTHDVVIALAVFSLLNVEINLPTIGAFLTIVGYSLNDTIVYFDRIRENEGLRRHKDTPTFNLINLSINQSLPRTLGTSVTTFMPVLALFIFGGPVLRAFSLALLIGVIIGTYSSIYVASPIVYLWDKYISSE